ncbi:MAG: ATP-dependent DNA helicase [Ferruginibacter sp.]
MSSYRQQLQQKFTEEYARLNPQQQQAVDTIEGPVMVIAGPGTGKTQILAARIGKILLETDTLPGNILCLTYTDAGAIAMRRRLQQFIGADAYKVHIYTFHAFCNDVIQDNLSLFEKNSLDAISELENIQLFKELIDSFPKGHPLKRYRGDVYYEIDHLQKLFSSMKREGWRPEYIIDRIAEHLVNIETDDKYLYQNNRAGKWVKGDKKPAYAEQLERMEKLRAAVTEFENYQLMMRKRNRYDFDDMINWIIKAFEENEQLLLNYQERFQYILVDEYQDTSGTQNRLVELLINYWEQPNIFVVGDDDQSIFRFQGANVENMKTFRKKYINDILTVILTGNYRSVQPVLDISKSLIDNNRLRLISDIPGLTKDLVASREDLKDLTHAPELHEYSNQKEEMAGITLRIAALIAAGTEAAEIAVIYKENKYGAELAEYFRLKEIPFYTKRDIDILHNAFIQKIIVLMSWLNAEHDIPYGGDELLFEILHFDFYKIPPIEIAKLTTEANKKNTAENRTSIRRLLAESATRLPKDLFDTGIHEKLKKISLILEALVADVSNFPLQTLMDNIIREGEVLKYIMQRKDKVQLLQLLSAFFDFIKRETARNPSLDLAGFMEVIDLMKKENIPLPLSRTTGNEHGVNLLTAHGAKGLEFEYVFFAGCNSAVWEKKRKITDRFSMPDTMFDDALPAAGDHEELRRLFYVAITRAKKYLFLSYARLNHEGKPLEPTVFIAEIQQVHDLAPIPSPVSEDDMTDFIVLQFTAQAPEIEHAEEDFVDGLLSKFSMNVTALNNYLKCPLQFYYANLIRIPSGKNENTTFGSAVHHALEKMFTKMQQGGKEKFNEKEDVIDDFAWYMRRHRENFTKESFARRMEYGEAVLTDYYNKYINHWHKIVAIERNIRAVTEEGVPLKGKLDKLEFDGKKINVVDYKTGDIDKALLKLKGPTTKDPNGGDYWRQGVFYKILLDNYDQKDWQVVSTEFDFIEPDKKKAYRKEKIVITPEDTDIVKEQIATVWEKIQAKDFYTGCGKEDCHWCNFVKQNELAVELHEIEEEEEI